MYVNGRCETHSSFHATVNFIHRQAGALILGGCVQQEAKTASHEAAGSAKDDLRKLAREQRDAGKAHSAASHQAGQAAAAVADKRAELEAVRESNQELQEQQIQETQVRML